MCWNESSFPYWLIFQEQESLFFLSSTGWATFSFSDTRSSPHNWDSYNTTGKNYFISSIISKWHPFSINTHGWVHAAQTFKGSCLTCALHVQGWFTVFSAFPWPSVLLASCPGTTCSYSCPCTYGISVELGQPPTQSEMKWGQGTAKFKEILLCIPSSFSLCSIREQGKARLKKYWQGAWGPLGSLIAHVAPKGLTARQGDPR